VNSAPESLPRRPWVLLIFVVAAFQLPLIMAPSGTILDFPDFTKYFVPIHEFCRQSLLAGRWPLWNPYIYAGTPFAANPQTMVFYPPSWLYLLMPVLDAHRWLIVVHALLAAVAMRLYLRRIGLSSAATLAGAFPFALGGYFSTNASVGHLTMIFAMAWLPLALYFFEGWRQDGRRQGLVRCGLVMALQFLAGEPQSSYYTGVLLLAYALLGAHVRAGTSGIWNRLRALGTPIAALVLVAIVAALVSAVQLLPTVEMVRESDRAQNTYEFSTVMSMPLESLAGGLFLPWYSSGRALWFDAAGSHPLNINREFAIYVGLAPLLLATFSLRSQAFPAKLSRAVVLVAVVLMLGSHTPLYKMAWQAIPGLAFFRIPARANLLFLWALSVMSAYGMQRIGEDSTTSRSWRLGALAVLGAVTMGFGGRAILGLWRMEADGRLGMVPLGDPLFSGPLLALGIALVAIVSWPRFPRQALTVAVLALTVVDLHAARQTLPLKPASPEVEASKRRFQRLREVRDVGSEPFRVDLAPVHADALAGMAFGVENVNGYWPVSLRRFFRYVHEMRGTPPSPVVRHQIFDHMYSGESAFPLPLLNVRFASSIDPVRGTSSVLENLKPPPRAWIVDRAEVMGDEEQTLRRLKDPAFDTLGTVLLESTSRVAPVSGDASAGAATVFSIEPEAVRLSTRSSRTAYLVVSLPFYPGWRATIDERDVGLLRADYFLTALLLPEGDHEVVLRYEPWTFRAGAALTLLACALVLALETWSRRPGAQPRALHP
jgi:succinate dehydrogenase hydrophobic anchor subunit